MRFQERRLSSLKKAAICRPMKSRKNISRFSKHFLTSANLVIYSGDDLHLKFVSWIIFVLCLFTMLAQNGYALEVYILCSSFFTTGCLFGRRSWFLCRSES